VIKYAEYAACLAGTDYAAQLAMLEQLRPDLRFQLAALHQKKHATKLLHFLQAERNSSLLSKPELVVKVSTSKTVETSEQEVFEVAPLKTTSANYPEHYPPILQGKLVEAGQLTARKRKLSNSLFELQDKPQALEQTVSEILLLSETIDMIYMHKANFDTHGYLPPAWTTALDELPNSRAALTSRLDSVKRRLREYSAKLNNFTECTQAGEGVVRTWREKKQQYEQEKNELLQKIAEHK